jgi:phenylalanyl-tRNA synthetase alpha chain
MTEKLTVSQMQRLKELNVNEEIFDTCFLNKKQCDDFYKAKETELVRENRTKIINLINKEHRPLLCTIENNLVKWLTEKEGFTQVVTPIILPKVMLDKMTITSEHPLSSQVFWLDSKKCLRPMLAPNLYIMMNDIHKITEQPVRIFECGPCFRKETQGAQHMNEFTMLNFVELAGVKEGEQMARLKELAVSTMKAIGIDNYELEITSSTVYGETLDIVCEGVELASGAFGPHPLDSKWGIFDTWVGIGFGIERIAMVMGGYKNIKRVGRSLSYVDGARLNV